MYLTSQDISLSNYENGYSFLLKVHAGAKRNSLDGIQQGRLKLSITTAPEHGKANKSILKFLSTILELSRSDLFIISGENNSQKRIGVVNISEQLLLSKLSNSLAT